VVKNSQAALQEIVLGHFQTPLVPDTYETGTRRVRDTTPWEAKPGGVEKQSLFVWLVGRSPSLAARGEKSTLRLATHGVGA
jgi:hypothetical protein